MDQGMEWPGPEPRTMILWLPELQNGMQTSSYCRGEGEVESTGEYSRRANGSEGTFRSATVRRWFYPRRSDGKGSIPELLRHQDGKHWTKRTDHAAFQTPTNRRDPAAVCSLGTKNPIVEGCNVWLQAVSDLL
jgi:hypothetical protein